MQPFAQLLCFSCGAKQYAGPSSSVFGGILFKAAQTGRGSGHPVDRNLLSFGCTKMSHNNYIELASVNTSHKSSDIYTHTNAVS